LLSHTNSTLTITFSWSGLSYCHMRDWPASYNTATASLVTDYLQHLTDLHVCCTLQHWTDNTYFVDFFKIFI